MQQESQSQRRLSRQDRITDDRTGFAIIKILLHRDELALLTGMLFLIVSNPWLLLVVVSLVAAGILCTVLIRRATRRDPLTVLRAGHL